jgi:hypothetical protein
MKSTSQYLKKLLEARKRIDREDQHHVQRAKDFDSDSYTREPEEMPDWAKAIRAAGNDVRSV